MDNSDDYFQDAFELDENDLAILAAEEAKYAESLSQKLPKKPEILPPRKRQKTSDFGPSDDVLDVFLQSDGTYGVAGVIRQQHLEEYGQMSLPKELSACGSEMSTCLTQTGKLSNISSRNARRDVPPTAVMSHANMLPGESSLRPTQTAATKPTNLRSQPVSQDRDRPPNLDGVETATENNVHPGLQYEAELAALKSTVQMLNLETEKAKKALQDAELVRLAREGEVTMLRKKIENAAHQHAEDLIKLRETKAAASMEQARIQKEMKEQIERLRTEYIFKQHEVEFSTRKTRWSSRTKRTALGSQMSPVPLPPAMREWSSKAGGSNRNGLIQDTPFRRKIVMAEKQDHIPSRTGTKSRPAVTDLKFPGFENSFLPSSPLNSPSRSRHANIAKRNIAEACTPQKSQKRKETSMGHGKTGTLSPVKAPTLSLKSIERPGCDEGPMDDYIQDFDINVEMNDYSPGRGTRSLKNDSSPTFGQVGLDSIGDFNFSDEADRNSPLEECVSETIDWSEELHYLLFSHSCAVSKTLSFHFLLSADVLDQRYQGLCSAILETLGSKFKYASLHEFMVAVADLLLDMATILWESEYLSHLRTLFNLFTSIIAYIPSFTTAILHDSTGSQNCLKLSSLLCEIAMRANDIKEPKRDNGDSFNSLIHSMLGLLEIIAWTLSDVLCASLTAFLRSDRGLLILLDSRHHSSLISHTINALVLLGSQPSLSQVMVSVPSDELSEQSTKGNTSNRLRVPLVERLSSFFVDQNSLSQSDVDGDLSNILNFFSLVVSSLESRQVLLRSNTLVPSLIHYLSRLTTMLWEDDEKVMQFPDHTKSTVRNIKQTLYLLHRLAVPPSTGNDQGALDFDLRQKLFYAPHATFNGLTHLFIVTIGRLSYADPPEWLNTKLQAEVEKLTEPARDLMDLVIEGPEGDSVWIAYQDVGNEMTDNDDEMEGLILDEN